MPHGPRHVLLPTALLPALLSSGCWKDEYAEIPPDVLTFQPEVEAPLGWLVQPIEVDLQCPDGVKGRFFLLYPEDAAEAPMAAAVLYHGGSFDFVYAPDPADPLTGTHYADPSRLTAEWSVREVFSTLGMYPDQDPDIDHQGLLPTAFAEQNVAVMMPANCWGDLWASKSGGADNAFVEDYFFRQGRAAAEWSYRFLVDPLFASAFDVELPITVDPTRTYAVGLNEGGRAVGELLSIDNDADGLGDYHPAAVVLDSSPDDLSPFFDDPALYASVLEGVERLYPNGPERAARGSMATAPLPPRVGYLYSVEDPRWPDAVHTAAVERLTAEGAWVRASPLPATSFLNGGDNLLLARDTVDFLLNGTLPVGR